MADVIPVASIRKAREGVGNRPMLNPISSRAARQPLEALVSFANLTHRGHFCNAAALGIGSVAAYAVKHLGADIKAEIFQTPDEFADWLKDNVPRIACFSNYMWNENLSYEFARRLKERWKDTITVFGGPNYPLVADETRAFLKARPAIDFYVFREGEKGFVELFQCLVDYGFDIRAMKEDRVEIPHIHYMVESELVQGSLLPRFMDLDEIPSPYLTGLLDKSLEQGYIPIIETKKGCPFSCSFCEDGNERFNKVRGHSFERVRDELEYMAPRTSVPRLMLADLNFGMYRDDLEVCRAIASVQERYGWPKFFSGIVGKNNTERVLQAASIVKGSMIGAAVQSTDEHVLRNIKRQNISLDSYLQRVEGSKRSGGSSYSELILGLPGDSKKTHYRSNFTLMDAGVGVVRTHQLLLLPGAEVSSKEYRAKYGLKTRARVIPQTCGEYELFGKKLASSEIDAVCVENSTMSFEDYLDCREFNLTVEIFYNSDIHGELLEYLRHKEIPISAYILRVHDRARAPDSLLREVYDGFSSDSRELFGTKEELLTFLRQPGVIEKYRAEELGNNEQLMYRAIAFVHYMGELHRVAYGVAHEMLAEHSSHNDHERACLSELAEVSLARKKDLLTTDLGFTWVVHYDFDALKRCNFKDPLNEHFIPHGLTLEISHTEEQRRLIDRYVKLYGLSNNGLGNILNMFAIESFYREVRMV